MKTTKLAVPSSEEVFPEILDKWGEITEKVEEIRLNTEMNKITKMTKNDASGAKNDIFHFLSHFKHLSI
jgi:hypothetical protein